MTKTCVIWENEINHTHKTHLQYDETRYYLVAYRKINTYYMK